MSSAHGSDLVNESSEGRVQAIEHQLCNPKKCLEASQTLEVTIQTVVQVLPCPQPDSLMVVAEDKRTPNAAPDPLNGPSNGVAGIKDQ